MGFDGLMTSTSFVKEGGLLIVEGATSTIFPDYKLVNGVSVREPRAVRPRSIVRGIVADAKSPIMYGYDGRRSRVLQPGSRADGRDGGRRRARRFGAARRSPVSA